MANKNMKVILREDVNKLGGAGQIVDVKPGYGRNYLIPQGLARMATKGAVQRLEKMKQEAERRAERTVESARALADRLETTSVTIPVQAGEENKIHGSVSTRDIAEALAERDIEVDHKQIALSEEIHTLGEYTATVELISELKPQIKVWVVKK